MEKLSPGAGAAVSVPGFDGHAGSSEVGADIDSACEAHVVASSSGAEAGELESAKADSSAILECSGISAD